MPKLIFLSFILLGLYGCATVSEGDIKYHPAIGKDFSFKNKDLEFIYGPAIQAQSLEVKIINLTNDSLKIDWDKSAFIDLDGNSGRIIHSGVKYNERNNSQVPTMIPPLGKISDSLIPAEHIDWASDNWVIQPICGKFDVWSMNQWSDSTPSCFKGELGLFISYEVGGKSKNFTVKFKAEKLQKAKK
jgi:hypothetical protein